MSNVSEQMQVEFHNRASEKLFSVYNAFGQSVSNVSRRCEEFRFQQLKKQFATTLEQELQGIARNILEKHQEERLVKGVDLMFHHFIKDYLHRFIQKINDV